MYARFELEPKLEFKVLVTRIATAVLSALFLFLTGLNIVKIEAINTDFIEAMPTNISLYQYELALDDTIDVDALLEDLDYNAIEDYYFEVIVAPSTISYYESTDDSEPVYVIEEGTSVVLWTSDFGYGAETLPTNDKSWRLAIPMTEDGVIDTTELLYVKYDEIEEIALTWYAENQSTYESKSEFISTNLLNMDNCLYNSDIFVSPNFMLPVFTFLTWTLLVLAIIFFCVFYYAKRVVIHYVTKD